MKIQGLQKTSLIDFPGKISAVIFTGGCNLRCRYCYNYDLVERHEEMETYSEEYVFNFLKKRKGLLDGVTVTGGEPTLRKALPEFIKKVKNLGYEVKLDSNGFNPEMIDLISSENLVDYYAIDMKTSPSKYKDLTQVDVDISKLKKTINILKEKNCDFELRTTAVPGYLSMEDILEIKEFCSPIKKYFLQQYVNENTIDNSFEGIYAFSKEELFSFRDEIRTFADVCEVRGLG